MTPRQRVAYVIGFAAPPVLGQDELVRLLTSKGWDTYVILSPAAATWVDVKLLAQVSDHPVRVEPRMPHEHDPLPQAEAIIAAPITFNSLNKWAMGISDTLALGLLNESIGLEATVTAAPSVNSALRLHPAYTQSVRLLSAAGVTVLDPSTTTVEQPESGAPRMNWGQALPS